jgi:large repetitive protein
VPNTHTLDSVANKVFLFLSDLVTGKLVVLAGTIAALVAFALPASASAALPAVTLKKEAPKTALLGTQQEVHLVAENPKGSARGYNLTFRDVLPNGVKFVPGSAGEFEPKVVVNKSKVKVGAEEVEVEETVLLFENVADLSANSTFTLSYKVEPSAKVLTSTPTVENPYTNKAEDFLSERPRRKQKFNPKGEPIANAFMGKAAAQATTRLTAIKIEKSEPSPEGEILRGVQEHQTVYTLKVENNNVAETKGTVYKEEAGKKFRAVEVEDWLPAGLEFLGCGTEDHTTNPKGNLGSTEEYEGAGSIANRSPALNASCEGQPFKPYFVKTEENPPGLPPGVYTHVKWRGPETMAPGAKFEIQYLAGIPIFKNTLDWGGEAEPPAEGAPLLQTANLNNNQGAETRDEEELTNFSKATGIFGSTKETETAAEEEAKEVFDETELTRTAENLAIQKSVSPETIANQEISTWTFHIETSEYKFVNAINIDDELPNGLCPLGEENFEGPKGAIIEELAECDKVVSETVQPEYEVVGTGIKQLAPYTSVEEQKEGSLDGGFKLHWDKSTIAALGKMVPSEELILTFPTRTRTDYQSDYRSTTPVLTGDSWTNKVHIAGVQSARCVREGEASETSCGGLGTNEIQHELPNEEGVIDDSEAGQHTEPVTIDKTVRENDFTKNVPEKCAAGPKSEYVQGLPPELPLYRPGDEVCWTLRVNFASRLFSGNPVVTDFIPTDQEYVPGSAEEVIAPVGENDVPSTFVPPAVEEGSEAETLEWTLGSSVADESKVFEWRFKTKVRKGPENESGEISGNLMKFVYQNTAGQTFPLRDRAEVERVEPELELAKRVTETGTTKVAAGAPQPVAVKGGETATYQLTVTNNGNLEAEETEVWDVLPEGIACPEAGNITGPSGSESSCAAGIIKWKKVKVAVGASVPLTYKITVPKDVAPGHVFTNKSGIASFKSPTNTGEQFEYVPKNNINPEAPTPNTGPANAEASIQTTGANLVKTAISETTQGGNAAGQATIGEIIDYKVEAKVPANSKIYGKPVLTDELPATLLRVGTPTAELDGAALPGGVTVKTLPNGAAVEFSGPFPTTPGAEEHVLVLNFKARVLNLATNRRGDVITNKAFFEFKDKEEAEAITKKEAKAQTTVVEPNLVVGKHVIEGAPGGIVKPGDKVKYEVTASSEGTNVSTANHVVLVDTVPPGMRIVETGGGTPGPEEKTITWEIAEVEPGHPASRTYVLEVINPATAASLFENTVTGTTQSLPGVAPEGARLAGFEEGAYKSSASGYESKAQQSVRLVGATVSKTVEPTEGTIGKELTYKLKMKLPPGITFFDTTMVDTLPSGVVYDETTSAKCVEGCTAAFEGEELPERAGEGGTTLLGWYFANTEGTGERTLEVVFNAHIAQEKAGGVKVKSGDVLTNSVVGLYNEVPAAEPPTEVPTPGPGKNTFSEETNIGEATTTVVEPNLAITKSVAGEPALSGIPPIVTPGTKLTYTLKVKNEGTGPAWDFDLEDTPSALLTNIVPKSASAKVTTSPVAGEPLVWHVDGPILPGETVEVTYSAELVESSQLETGTPISNVAEIPEYFGLPPTERENPVNKYEPPPAEQVVNVEQPQPTITKTVGVPGSKANVGEPFPWRIVVGNSAEHARAKEIVVEDNLPAGWEYEVGSGKVTGVAGITPAEEEPVNPAANPLVWKFANLAAEGEIAIEFAATPEVSAVKGPNLNTASVHFKDLSGSEEHLEEGAVVPYEAESEAEAEVIGPEFEVIKTPDEETKNAGEEVAYRIEVKNIGNGKASKPIEVEDELRAEQEFVGPGTLPAGVTFVSVSPEHVSTGQLVHWTIASLEPGASVVIPVPIKIPAADDAPSKILDFATVRSPQAPGFVRDEGSFKVERSADLKIEKKATGVNGGEAISYTLTATDLGPSNASEVEVFDFIPEGTEFVKAAPKPGTTGTCAEGEAENKAGEVKPAVICDVIGELTPGQSAEFEVEFEVESKREGESLSNTATVHGKEPDPNPNNNEVTIETVIGESADLSIVKTGPTQPVLLGNTFAYKLEVKNEGPSDAKPVKVKDKLPAEVEFVEAKVPAGVTCSELAGTLTCELGPIVRKSPPTVIEVIVKATALSPEGELTENTAEVSSETPDPEPENNESTAETQIVPAADLSIVKTAPATVEPNGELTYKLQVEDKGPSNAHKVVVTDPLPAGTEFVKASEGCSAAGTVVTCEVVGGELEANKVAAFQITVHVPYALGGAPLTNTASVSAEEGDPHPEDNSSTVTTTVGPAADLAITKTMGKAEAGKPLVYTLAITNHGPSASSAVTVKDTLPAGTTFKSAAPSQGTCSASGQTVTCQLGELASGGSAQVSITVEVAATATGSIRNVASVEGPEPDPDKSNNESAVEGPVTPAPPGGTPNLKVVKTADTSTPQVGVPFDYDVAISNSGDAEAKNVKVVDTLSGPVKVVSIDAGPGKCNAVGSKIECTIPSIGVGKTVHVTYSVVAESTGALSNTASAMAANGEKAPSNNHAVKGVHVKAPKANFTLAKKASRPVVPGGQKVGFTITLHNGAAALTDAKVCDRLPAALVFVKAAGAAFVNGEACWKEHYVAPHKVLRLHLMARAVKGYTARRARNVASASAANAKGVRKASATVRIKPVFGGAPGGVTG